jgi:hypothetical protein
MKIKKLLPWLLVGYAAYWVFTQSRRIDVGTASISRVKLEGGGVRINLKLPILNRGNIRATVQGFLGQIYYGPNPIGVVTLVQPTVIEPNAVSQPEFTALLSYASVGMEIASVILDRYGIPGVTPPPDAGAGTSQPVRLEDFRIRGTLRVADIAIDIDQTIFV